MILLFQSLLPEFVESGTFSCWFLIIWFPVGCLLSLHHDEGFSNSTLRPARSAGVAPHSADIFGGTAFLVMQHSWFNTVRDPEEHHHSSGVIPHGPWWWHWWIIAWFKLYLIHYLSRLSAGCREVERDRGEGFNKITPLKVQSLAG